MKFKSFLILFIILALTVTALSGCRKPVVIQKGELPEDAKKGTFDWTIEYIDKLAASNVLEETESKDPLVVITRGNFVKWLVKAKGYEIVQEGASFIDVPAKNPNHDFIITAAVNNVISQDGGFRPDDPLLRADSSIWLVNAWGQNAIDKAAEYTETMIPAQDAFDDVPQDAIGPMTVCYLPEYQMLYFRYKDGDEFRYCKPMEPMIFGEAAHSIYMLQNPPKRGGNLTIGQSQEPKTLFFGADTMSAMTQVTSCLANSSVGGFDENWCLYPIMIKRVPTVENGLWKIFDDGKRMEVTYELRKGMKWSDGVDITAEDAVFSFYLGNHPAFPTVHTQIDKWVDKVEAVDPYTVKVYWNTNYLYANLGVGLMPKHYFNYEFNYSLNDPNYYISDDPDTEEEEQTFKSEQYLKDEAWISKIVESEYKERPLHCGPYKVKSWERGQTIILEANDLYLYGRPLIDTITFRTIENTDTLLASALAGNVNMTLVGLTFDQAQQIVKRPDTSQRAVFTPSLTWEHIDLNIDDPELSDVRVRRALLHSIDREAITNQFFDGKNTVSDSWLPPKHPGFDESIITKYEFSMEKANQLLDEAGWILNPTTKIREKDGKKLSITFMTTAQNKAREQVQAVISSNWRDIGVNVETKNEIPTSFFTTTLANRKFTGPTGAMYAWVMGPNSNLYSIVNGTQIPSDKNGFTGQNYTAFNNETVNTLTDDIQKSMDKKDIYQKLKECQKILTEELPTLPLYTRVDVTSVDKKIMGYKPTGTSTALTWNIEYWYWESN